MINYKYTLLVSYFNTYIEEVVYVWYVCKIGQQKKFGISVDATTLPVIPMHQGWYHDLHLACWTKVAIAPSGMPTLSLTIRKVHKQGNC